MNGHTHRAHFVCLLSLQSFITQFIKPRRILSTRDYNACARLKRLMEKTMLTQYCYNVKREIAAWLLRQQEMVTFYTRLIFNGRLLFVWKCTALTGNDYAIVRRHSGKGLCVCGFGTAIRDYLSTDDLLFFFKITMLIIMLLQDFYVNGKKLRLRKFLSQRKITKSTGDYYKTWVRS